MTLTMSYISFVQSLFKDGNSIAHDIAAVVPEEAISRLHAVIGIVGELHELGEAIDKDDEENILEELGDLVFYMEALKMWLPVVDFEFPANWKDTQHAAAELLDLSKKEVIYAKKLSEDQLKRFIAAASATESGINEFIDVFGYTKQQVIEANVAKLSKRYPAAQYSNEAAAARLDKIGTGETK